jgi:hypothetical protein
MKNAVFWDVTPYGPCKNRRFGGTCASIIRVTRWLLVTASVPISPIVFTLMTEELVSSETSALIGATWRNIPEDGILRRF